MTVQTNWNSRRNQGLTWRYMVCIKKRIQTTETDGEKKAYFCECTGVSQRRGYSNYPRMHCYHWHLSDSSVYMVHQGGAKKEAEGLQPLLITHCGTFGRFLWRTVCLAQMFKCICPRLTHKENYHVLSWMLLSVLPLTRQPHMSCWYKLLYIWFVHLMKDLYFAFTVISFVQIQFQ